MKITHIVGSLEARYGGPSRSVRRLATATADLGHEVELLTSAPEAVAPEHEGRLTVRTWRRVWPQGICRVPQMAAYLQQTNSDVVHHHGLWLRPLHYARAKAARARIPLVISPRGMMSRWAWGHHRVQKACAARCVHPGAFMAANGWHVTSGAEAEEVRARGFSQPICVAPNGVDRPEPADSRRAFLHWRTQISVVEGRPVALFYSRFHEKKRVLELIALWPKIARPGWVLLLVGLPDQYSVSYLRAVVARRGATGLIEVHDGTNQPPPYAIASLFLLPSHSENFGLVIAEAMAHGIPAIATNMTPWSDLNALGCGWCVPWEEFGAAVMRATSESAAELAARGERAREFVLREFSWERSTRELVAFYETLRQSIA